MSAAPKVGPHFRRAAALKIDGRKRRRLLALIAAYADAGEQSPRVQDLAQQLGLPARKIDQLLDALVADGLLLVEWAAGPGKPAGRRGNRDHRRNRYILGTWAR